MSTELACRAQAGYHLPVSSVWAVIGLVRLIKLERGLPSWQSGPCSGGYGRKMSLLHLICPLRRRGS